VVWDAGQLIVTASQEAKAGMLGVPNATEPAEETNSAQVEKFTSGLVVLYRKAFLTVWVWIAEKYAIVELPKTPAPRFNASTGLTTEETSVDVMEVKSVETM
jgi:hypothetical protein